MSIPTQETLDQAAAAFRAADEHLASRCGLCHPKARLPEMCPDGQRLTLAAANSISKPADPFNAAASVFFEQDIRDGIARELVYYADGMEAGQPERADVRRDAYYVRRAARIARDGITRHRSQTALPEEQARHMAELERLRAELEEEHALRASAEDWADTLAEKVAPPSVIGRRGEPDRYPWGDALDLITPAAEVTALRTQLAALQGDGQDPAEGCTWWTPERAAEIRQLVNRIAGRPGDPGADAERDEWVTVVAADTVLALQLRNDWLERRVHDLQVVADRLVKPPRTFAEGGCVDDLGELYSVQHAITAADGALTRDVHRALDALRAVWERALVAEQDKARVLGREIDTAAPDTYRSVPCPQNRLNDTVRPGDKAVLGGHSYKDDEAGIPRCVFCGTAAHWGGEPESAPRVPDYVFNARSVNRTTKHAVDPDEPAITLCPRQFVASPPMSTEDAARLPLCGGCRRALTGQQD